MKSRQLDSVEKAFISMKCYAQLVIELENEKRVLEFINKLQKYVIGFHLKADDNNLILHHDKQPVHELPKGMTDHQQITDWIYHNHTLSTSQTLASIAARDNLIAVNINHICVDGRILKALTETLPLPEEVVTHSVPPSQYSLFKDDIERINDLGNKMYFPNEDPRISRLIPKQKPDNILKNTGFDMKKMPLSKLACNKNGKIKGLTEALWTAGVLTIAAYNETLEPCGASTSIDLRHYIGGNYGQFEIGSCVGSVSACTDMIPEETVGDLGEQMRKDFQRQFGNHEAFAFQASAHRVLVQKNPYPSIPGVGFELSNIGPVKLQRPIKNILMSSMSPEGQLNMFSCASFSTVSEIPECNQITTGLFFSNQTLSLKEASLINDSIQFSLSHIKPEMKIIDALTEVKGFQIGHV